MTKINKEKQAAVPQKLLHELFDYNELTGKISNKIHRNSRARAGQIAGSLDKKSGYLRIGVNGYIYLAHRLAWAYVYGDYPDGEQPYIDHINGKRDDNRIENLKVSSMTENNRNKQIMLNNTSGINGISRYEITRPSGKIDAYWKTSWCDENGKRRQKNFPIRILGESKAKQIAIDYRFEQLHLLELDYSTVYSERHGI